MYTMKNFCGSKSSLAINKFLHNNFVLLPPVKEENFYQERNQQESCAIAKMTARCALYM